MHPLGFNGIEPGTFRGQQAWQDAHALAGLLDRLVVAPHPGANHLTLLPRGVIPDQDESRDRLRCQMLATSGQKVDGHGTDGTAIDKAYEHVISLILTAEQHSITSQRFGIGVLFAAFQFLQPRQIILIYPAMLIGLSQSAPPDFIGETQRPGRMSQHQTDQTIPSAFFPDLLGIRTRDPVLRTFPAHAQLAKRLADRFSTDRSAGDAYGDAHLGCQLQRPDTAVLPKGARTLMQ